MYVSNTVSPVMWIGFCFRDVKIIPIFNLLKMQPFYHYVYYRVWRGSLSIIGIDLTWYQDILTFHEVVYIHAGSGLCEVL